MLRVRSRASFLVVVAALLVLGLTLTGVGLATIGDSGSGTISPASPTVSWTGPVQTAVTNSPSDSDCNLPGAYCDDYTLTVDVPADYWDTHTGGATITISWATPANDFDLYVYSDAARTQEVDHSATGAPGTSETVFVPNAAGPYYLRIVYFTVVDEGYEGTATLQSEQGGGGGALFDDTTVTFNPATIVSAHFISAEPQTTVERPASDTQEGAIDPDRIFVDWPLSSRSNIGQLNRSMDGSDSFRLLYDLTCAPRSRPNCLTGGGGDTENDVNPADGSLYFADQEALAQEALAISYDHGDTWPIQYAINNTATGVDRQWLAATDNSLTLGPATISAFFAYHVPIGGQYIQGIDENGALLPQSVPQIPGVSQSGQLRVDNTDGPGHGWIYQPYRAASGNNYVVATANGADGSWLTPVGWITNTVSTDQPTIFPWLSLDDHGNAYAVWVDSGVMYMSASPIDDKANNPTLTPPGRPGSFWTPKVQVNLPTVTSTVFPEVIGGDPGRIGITYVGSTTCTGSSNDCPEDTLWNAYGAVIKNALSVNGPPVVATGKVSHRFVHQGDICTSGTACLTTGKDRSLLDMIDIGVDQSGRVGVVFTDNYSTFGNTAQPPGGGEDNSPFIHFAKLSKGPLLFGSGTATSTLPSAATLLGEGRRDPRGDATWPNTSEGKNLQALDALGLRLFVRDGRIIAKFRISDPSERQAISDLARYNSVPQTNPPAERIQWTVRFSTGTEIFHISAERLADGTLRFFGGRLDGNDNLINPATLEAGGAGYHTDPGYHVTGKIRMRPGDKPENNLVLSAPAADYGVSVGTRVFSVTGFTFAGPVEASETLPNPMRTLDGTPPYDREL